MIFRLQCSATCRNADCSHQDILLLTLAEVEAPLTQLIY